MSATIWKLLRTANKAGITLEPLADGEHMDIVSLKRPKPKMRADLIAFKPAILEVLRHQRFPTPSTTIITSKGQLEQAIAQLCELAVVALDVETMARLLFAGRPGAALSTVMGQIRLVQLYSDASGAVVFDAAQFGLDTLTPLLDGPQLVGHNVAFDLSMLAAAGLPIPPGKRIFDTMVAANLMDSSDAGHFPPHALDDLVERYLDLYLPKTEQVSDWSAAELSPAQLEYAATDAYAAWRVAEYQRPLLAQQDLTRVMELEMRALPAAIRLLRDGTPFNAEIWAPMAEKAELDFAEVTREIMELIGPEYTGLNLRSYPQRMELLKARGHKPGKVQWAFGEQEWKESTDAETLREMRLISDDPLLEMLQRWGTLYTRTTRYGVDYPADHVQPDGRLHGGYRAVGTATGRATCSQPNLLQIPRQGTGSEYRLAFRCAPGRVIVHADYSQIQLRIGADQSGDETLIAAYARNARADIHRLTASRLYSCEEVAISDDQRQTGKTCGLALEFGMGADRLRSTMFKGGQLVSREEAQRLHTVFHTTYPGLRRWQMDFADGAIDLRTMTGRRRRGVSKFTEKPNSTAQMIEADGMKTSLALLALHWNEIMPASAKLILLIYDEIDIECDIADANQVAEALRDLMVRGMQPFLEHVPVIVDTNIWQSWGGDEPE
jgi:DNA polymerase-1